MKKAMISLALFVVFSSFLLTNSSKAYVIYPDSKQKKYTNPTALTYHVASSASDFVSVSAKGTSAWNPSAKVEWRGAVSQPGVADLVITYDANQNPSAETVAQCFYSSTNLQKRIVFYKKYFELNNSVKKTETAVHEVGHALGLDHTQESNNSIAVMRQYGFNETLTPLSDDWTGVYRVY